MLHLTFKRFMLCFFVFIIPGILVAQESEIESLRKWLTSHYPSYQFRRRALLTLADIGTRPAIDAIREFESWSKKRFIKPPAFQFGEKDHAIHTYVPHQLTPLAKTTDEKNRTWAIFQWKRYGREDTWLTRAVEKEKWSRPILLYLPRMPTLWPYRHTGLKWDDKCSFQIKNDSIKIVVDKQIWESRISDHLADLDRDGLPDLVEARLLTDPNNPDSDKDGLPDGKDSNPLTPRHSDSNDITEIRQVVFSFLFATSNSQDALVIVGGADFAKQEYYGFGDFVLRSPEIRRGFVNITGIKVKLKSPDAATAYIGDYEGSLAASGHVAKLKKLHGKWVVVEFEMTWQS